MGRKRKSGQGAPSKKKRKVQTDSEEETDEEIIENEDVSEEVSKKSRRKNRKRRAKTETFVVERPLKIICFEKIHELYFKHRDQRFADIFESWNENTKEKKVAVSKYFYYTKWESCTADKSSYIQDGEFPKAAYRDQFRIFNGYPKDGVVLEVKTEVPPADNYQPPQIVKTSVETSCTLKSLYNFKITLYDEEYNWKFGMFPLKKETYERKENWVYASDQTKRFIGYSEIKPYKGANEVVELVNRHQYSNKECLRLLILHNNIVAMHDMFYWRSPIGQLWTVSVEEWCSQSLRDRIEKDQDLDWKRVCKDILTAFSLIHGYGIHGGVSLENIRYNESKDCYQLTGFKNFKFGKTHETPKWESIEFAPRKFGIHETTLKFDCTVDLYALAICMLHVKRKDLQFKDLTSLADIENTIEESLLFFDDPEEKRFVRRMLRARMWLHEGMETLRLSAKSLLRQLVYLGDESYSRKKCIYLHSMTGIFTNETLYFTSADDVKDVVNRLISPHYQNDKSCPEYVMLCSKDFSDSRTSSLVIPNRELFVRVAELVDNNSNQILIVPKLKTTPAEPVRQDFWFEIRCIFEQELGACPILITSHNCSETQMENFIKKNVVSKKYRNNTKVILKRRVRKEHEEHKELDSKAYLIKLVNENGSVSNCENRWKNLKEFDERLEGKLLEKEDVGGKCISETNSEESDSD